MKPGDKLVCVQQPKYDDGTEPKLNEIVTYNGYSSLNNNYIYISEYTVNSKGATQSFKSVLFRPLDEVLSEIGISEVEEVLTRETVEK